MTGRRDKGNGRGFASAFVAPRIPTIRRALLRWFDSHGRSFSWRQASPSPYSILVAESLLAKTRAEVVEPVARRLLSRYAEPRDLAKARRADLQSLLHPLGLHRKRAKQLLECAKAIVAVHGGEVPEDVESLMSLPSIGRYAANAIALVAFDQRTPVVDANVVRVYRRVFTLPLPPERLSSAERWWQLAARVLPRSRAKQFTWALLDVGGTVCLPKQPQCDRCPLARSCNYARQALSKNREG